MASLNQQIKMLREQIRQGVGDVPNAKQQLVQLIARKARANRRAADAKVARRVRAIMAKIN